jgi:hypothetical protein
MVRHRQLPSTKPTRVAHWGKGMWRANHAVGYRVKSDLATEHVAVCWSILRCAAQVKPLACEHRFEKEIGIRVRMQVSNNVWAVPEEPYGGAIQLVQPRDEHREQAISQSGQNHCYSFPFKSICRPIHPLGWPR